MSLNLNLVMLGGNLTRDPEVRFLPNETAVANFGIAVNRKYKGNDGNLKEEVTFIDCEAWGKTAENIGKYLTKGSSVFVEGRLKLETWEDKEKTKRSKIKVVVESIQFTGSPKQTGSAPAAATTTAPTSSVAAPRHDDEPPF